jgi:hypothetical protein
VRPASGQDPILGEENHGQNVASSATQSGGVVGGLGDVTGSLRRHDLDLDAASLAGKALDLD